MLFEFHQWINGEKSTLNQRGYHVRGRRDVISTYFNVESTFSVCWEDVICLILSDCRNWIKSKLKKLINKQIIFYGPSFYLSAESLLIKCLKHHTVISICSPWFGSICQYWISVNENTKSWSDRANVRYHKTKYFYSFTINSQLKLKK